jgi:hypothetical protein
VAVLLIEGPDVTRDAIVVAAGVADEHHAFHTGVAVMPGRNGLNWMSAVAPVAASSAMTCRDRRRETRPLS